MKSFFFRCTRKTAKFILKTHKKWFLHDAMMDSLWRLWEETLWWSLFAMWLCSSAYQMVSLRSCPQIWADFVSCFDQLQLSPSWTASPRPHIKNISLSCWRVRTHGKTPKCPSQKPTSTTKYATKAILNLPS